MAFHDMTIQDNGLILADSSPPLPATIGHSVYRLQLVRCGTAPTFQKVEHDDDVQIAAWEAMFSADTTCLNSHGFENHLSELTFVANGEIGKMT